MNNSELYQAVKNGNTLIIGQPGSGKNMCANSLLIQDVENSTSKVLVIDEEKEYLNLAKAFNGNVATYSSENMKLPTDSKLTVIVPENEKFGYSDTEVCKVFWQIFEYALLCNVNKLFFSLDSLVYGDMLLKLWNEYKESMKGRNIYVISHDISNAHGTEAINGMFENIIALKLHPQTEEYLSSYFGFSKSKLQTLKRGEYLLKATVPGTLEVDILKSKGVF